MLRNLLAVLFIFTLVMPATLVAAETMPASVKTALESKSFATYPEAVYCTGTLEVGIRFASNKSPDEVRAWYRQKYPEWSVMEQYGSWVLYNGAPGASMSKVMSGNQIMIQKNDQIPSWQSLPADMTTEIMASFPE